MKLVILFASSMLLVACGGGPDFACDVTQTQGGTTSHACSEVETLPAIAKDQSSELCAQMKGTLVGSCASDGQVGVCAFTSGGITQNIHYYSDGGLTAAVAEQGCTAIKGTWTPG